MSYKFLHLFRQPIVNQSKDVIEIPKKLNPIDAVEISYSIKNSNPQTSLLQIGEGPNFDIHLTEGKRILQHNDRIPAAFLSATASLSPQDKAQR